MNVKYYCYFHRACMQIRLIARVLLKGQPYPYKKLFVSFNDDDFEKGYYKYSSLFEGHYVNDILVSNKLEKSSVFPVENLLADKTGFNILCHSYLSKDKFRDSFCKDQKEASEFWKLFLKTSKIPNGYKYGGLLYGGFIKEYQEWCLPSWIWTNAAIVRYYCSTNNINEALEIGELLLKYQHRSGGWIVRNDYGVHHVKPLLAPNDSAYIANNACLEIYKHTGDNRFLKAAKKCADWIMINKRDDGLVFFGFDTVTGQWEKNHNIVDIGFTAALFAELYQLTKKTEYLEYLQSFSKAYIKAFYDKNKKRFCSSIGLNDVQRGIGFARGQAWALEGLISTYKLLKSDIIAETVNATVSSLLSKQNVDGSWPRELDKPKLGSDCKGTSVIARSILRWTETMAPDYTAYEKAMQAVKNSMEWCSTHTLRNGEGAGGIYSFCYEGAIVHHPYTSTAFVYGSSYALEIYELLNKEKKK